MDLLLAITWNASPEIVTIGPITLRWYGLLFAAGFLIGLYIVKGMFKEENAPEPWLDKAFMHVVLGAVIGARLGHVFFYDWDFYSENLAEIPKIWRGGLASHGGAIGIIIALWFFSINVSKKSVLWILDKVVVPTALAGFFIRLGNLMNSEILGRETDVAWAFIFVREDAIPRHPVQLYESILYLISFFVLFWLYKNSNAKQKQGFFFGLFLVLIFGFRILMEFFKESQGGFESSFGNLLSTGQLLSIPFVLLGLFFVFKPGGPKLVLKK
jgi:prolipoprotein diacylglyceryl transferase